MPKYVRNTSLDIEFLTPEGVFEFLEDSLSNLPRNLVENDTTKILFNCLRSKMNLNEISEATKSIIWDNEPFELQAIAVGLKLFRR